MENRMALTSYLYKAVSLCLFVSSGSVLANQLSPAPYKTMDNNQVNMASGHVSPTLTDISIGGAMGLTHTISTTAGNFGSENPGNWGPVDKFRGGLYNVLHKDNGSSQVYHLRAFGPGGGADFKILANGTYEAVNDIRNTLEFVPGIGYVFTTLDGTENHYPSTGSSGTNDARNFLRANLSKVIYPNGFTITITKSTGSMEVPIYSVNTNTGFQLKYLYESDNRAVPSSVQNAVAKNENGHSIQVNLTNWHAMMPKYIKGINNAIDYCHKTASTCNYTKDWPTVTYEWPAGMPKAFWVGSSVFKVTDAMGRTTEYKHEAIDIYDGVIGASPSSLNKFFIPRIVEIKDSRSNAAKMSYNYFNKGTYTSGIITGGLSWQAGEVGVLANAVNNGVTQGYNIGLKETTQYGYIIRTSNQSLGPSYKGVKSYFFDPHHGVPIRIDTWSNVVTFGGGGYDNKVYGMKDKLTNVNTVYQYDGRGNVTSVKQAPNSASPIEQTAIYPTVCNNANRKFCNKASSITDGNGNTTSYQYHADSGQVARVTSPPNEDGTSKVTRYEYGIKTGSTTYTPYFAIYKINGNYPSTSSDGIWLLTSEKTCINSATNGSSCAGNDEVEIKYQYDAANLFMIGKAVVSGGQTLRTCYRYDIYGNQIGVTEPNANLSTCVY
jgi:hypothetical protein